MPKNINLKMNSLVLLSIFVALATAAKLPRLEPRVTNGKNAELGQFPWQVGIGSKDYIPWCGGALINESFVLTAGHCIGDEAAYYLVLGATNVKDQEGVRRVVKTKAVHKDYDKDTLANDVALLYLEEPIELTDNIKVINMATKRLGDKEVVVVSGWGDTESDEGYPADLKYTEMTTISNEECIIDIITDKNICAIGKDGKSACNGDSGGPVVQLKEGEEPLLVGVVSMGSSVGCQIGLPVGFSRVEDFSDWILETMDTLAK